MCLCVHAYVYTCVQACMCARILRSAANFSYCFLSVIHLGLFVCLFVLVIVLRQGPLLAWDLSGRLACLANCGDSAQHHTQLFQCLVIICFIYFLVHSGGSKLGHRSCKTNTWLTNHLFNLSLYFSLNLHQKPRRNCWVSLKKIKSLQAKSVKIQKHIFKKITQWNS